MGAAATLERPQAAQGVTLDAAVLARAMRAAAKVVEARNTIPILSNVRLVADPVIGKLELVTTDLDVEYRQRIALSEGSGRLSTTVEAGRLAALAGAVPSGGQMRMVSEDGRLIVSAGRSRWVLPCLPADDFPSAEFAGAHYIDIEPASRLAYLIERVLWSRCTEAVRYYMSGPLFHGENGKVRLAATNGHTVVAVTMDHVWPDGAPEVILAPKFCANLQSLAADASGLVRLSWNERQVRAELGEIVLTGKVIDGSFPDYRRVIPPHTPTPILIEPDALREAVRRVRLIGDEKTGAIKFSPGVGAITLSHTSVTAGNSTEDVPADCQGGTVCAFNADYLSAMLAAIGGDSMEIHHEDPGVAAMFRRVVDDGALGVIMPMLV